MTKHRRNMNMYVTSRKWYNNRSHYKLVEAASTSNRCLCSDNHKTTDSPVVCAKDDAELVLSSSMYVGIELELFMRNLVVAHHLLVRQEETLSICGMHVLVANSFISRNDLYWALKLLARLSTNAWHIMVKQQWCLYWQQKHMLGGPVCVCICLSMWHVSWTYACWSAVWTWLLVYIIEHVLVGVLCKHVCIHVEACQSFSSQGLGSWGVDIQQHYHRWLQILNL